MGFDARLIKPITIYLSIYCMSEKTCRACQGVGKFACQAQISSFNTSTHNWIHTPCPICGGTGWRMCGNCHGTGKALDN